jgi:hypothetical protein
MGFYHPATLVKDAQRHGVRVRPIDVLRSDWLCSVEGRPTIRLGLMYIRGLRKEAGLALERARREAPFTSIDDLQARAALRKPEITVLAEVGALNSLGMKRREALWQVEKVWRKAGPLYAAIEKAHPEKGAPLADMTAEERVVADSLEPVPAGPSMTLERQALTRPDLPAAGCLSQTDAGSKSRRSSSARGGTARGSSSSRWKMKPAFGNIVNPVYEANKLACLLLPDRGGPSKSEWVTSVKASAWGWRPPEQINRALRDDRHSRFSTGIIAFTRTPRPGALDRDYAM